MPRKLSRVIFREMAVSALLGTLLFTFVVFMRRAGPLFEILARNTGSSSTVAYLFALVLPQALPYSIPLGVLIGTLITLSRMSTDGEITAMRATGVSGRRVAPPILTLAFLAMCITAAASLWLAPWAIRERYRVVNQLVSGQLTAEVQPGVFEEQFPNSILYVAGVAPGGTSHWKRVFLADVTPPDKLPPGAAERGDSPRVTLAAEAVAVADVAQNRIQLSLPQGSTYEAGKDPADYRVVGFDHLDQSLPAQRPSEVRNTRPAIEMDTIPLYRVAYGGATGDGAGPLDARIELHQRLALPLACLLLALAGIPLGVTTRRSGKSSAVVLTVGLAFLYYMGLISMISVARQETLPAGLALWLPNLVFTVFGLAMLTRLEAPGEHDYIGRLLGFARAVGRVPQARVPRVLDRIQPRWSFRIPLLPGVVDTYILFSFLFYFVMLLVSFVAMTHVFTFFELLSDIIKNRTPLERILSYHMFLTPRLIYDLTPIAVLTSVLVVFGVLAKHNEITAFKASGVSQYRLAAPVLIASMFLSAGAFAFEHYWVPEADRRQNAIRAEIKGKPAQTFLRPDRKWIRLGDRIYYYKYFDQDALSMLGVSVYEIDPATFRLKRHISAERARWEPGLKSWVFQNGWSREMRGNGAPRFDDFTGGIRSYPEVDEAPSLFVKEVKQSYQMNYHELEAYIAELERSGFDTVPLQVQFYKKFSVPLFAFIMALVAIPFAFLAGNRGAMAGVGLALAVAIAYWGVDRFSEQVGNLGQLPATAAAWSPDALFSLVGLYFMARMRT